MGLTDGSFWQLTPRVYRALVARYELRQRRADHRFGTLAALVASVAGSKKEDGTGYTPADFFPELRIPKTIARSAKAVETLEESIAEGWQTWARKTQEIAAARGVGHSS